MKIELGKYYRTRDGHKVGPMEQNSLGFHTGKCWFGVWTGKDNIYYGGRAVADKEHPLDLVNEWMEPYPIQTITQKKIVPGVYGNLSINDLMGIHVGWTYGVDGIKKVIETLQEIVEVLEENK